MQPHNNKLNNLIDSSPQSGEFENGLTTQVQEIRNEFVAENLNRAIDGAVDFLPSSKILDHTDFTNAPIMDLARGSMPYSRMMSDILESSADEAGVDKVDGVDFNIDKSQIHFGQDGAISTFRYFDAKDGIDFIGSYREAVKKAGEPFRNMAERLKQSEDATAVTDEVFSLNEDSDLVATYMGRGSLRSSRGTIAAILLEEMRDNLKIVYPEDEDGSIMDDGQSDIAVGNRAGIYLNEDGRIDKILVGGGKGLYKGMYFDHNNNSDAGDPALSSFRLGMEYDLNEVNLEAADGEGGLFTEPFIETQTAKDIFTALEEVDLGLSVPMQELMAESTLSAKAKHNSRYGNGYTELMREVAKFVNDPDRSPQGFFESSLGREEIIDKLSGIDLDDIDSGPAKFTLGIMQLALNRVDTESDIPVFEGFVSMRAGSCKDSEVKYLQSTNLELGQSLPVTYENGIPMLDKVNNGDQTSINLTTLKYKGVMLPAGCLFKREDKGEGTQYVFVRATSFMFNPEEARDAFTWQYMLSSGVPSANRADSNTFKNIIDRHVK